MDGRACARGALAAMLVAVGAAAAGCARDAVPEVVPTAGMVIETSTRFAPGTYRLPASAEAPAIRVRGDGVTLDLDGVTLEGGDPLADPDGYAGTGILIEDSRGVTVTGGAIRGYKVGILARQTPALHLTGIDLSYNWKPRLWSGIERESLLDWMSYHDNEDGQWLRYGAAIYLDRADGAEVDHVRVTQGQNGLMVTHSSGLNIWNNDFSFNSAVGLGFYRTTDSRILHNKLDWNVRGYSHGFYYRGQDSTGILMYEQSSNNVVAYNSATHGGDGLFLWAGQSTMDTGEGGANDNEFWHNDFSHAVANGIEATFSRNLFYYNRVDDCWHGVWGGYSFESHFYGNTFRGNDEGMAIEHGQDITIAHNTFEGGDVAIRLWANDSQDPNWGYPKARDTRSRDYVLAGNAFSGVPVALDVRRTSSVTREANAYERVAERERIGEGVDGLGAEGPERVSRDLPRLPALPDGQDAMLPDGARRGRSTIIVDEWGPYDYRFPKLWPVEGATFHDRPMRMRVMGPPGEWRVVSAEGATVDRASGAVPGEVVLEPLGRNADVRVAFEYVGDAVVSPRGEPHRAGATVPFAFTWFEPGIDWDVRWWTFDEASDPLAASDAFARRFDDPPVRRDSLPRLDFVGSGAFGEGLPRDRFALRAEGAIDLPPGDYVLDVISDDGIRVWIDDELVIERWDVHGSALDQVPVSSGTHRIRIEYFEMTGWAELKVGFRRQP